MKQLACMAGLILMASCLEDNSCRSINCKFNSNDLKCVQVLDTGVYLNHCPNTYYCPDYSQLGAYTESWTNVTCLVDTSSTVDICSQTITSLSLNAGDECCESINCVSNSCVDGYCEGIQTGSACLSDAQCIAGSYCRRSDSVCAETFGEGEACLKDYECGAGHGCDDSNCTQLFSKDYGVKASNAKYCTSNYLASNGYCDGLVIWFQNSELDYPYECDLGYTCQYRSLMYQTIVDRQPCSCAGIADKTTGYCGDHMDAVKDNIGDIYSNLVYNSSICSGDQTHTNDVETLYKCQSISEDHYNSWLYSTQQFVYWNLYQSGAIDDCADEIGLFNPDYDGAISLAAISFLLIANL